MEHQATDDNDRSSSGLWTMCETLPDHCKSKNIWYLVLCVTMAECDSGQKSFSPNRTAQTQGGEFQSHCEGAQSAESVPECAADLEGQMKHKPHKNGLVTHHLKAADDVENGESADSGHGSSCQDCECASALSQIATVEFDMTRLSVTPENTSVCKDSVAVSPEPTNDLDSIRYVVYESEEQMPDIIRLITKDLSEPYSIYTYRYFIHNWPKLCLLVRNVLLQFLLTCLLQYQIGFLFTRKIQ